MGNPYEPPQPEFRPLEYVDMLERKRRLLYKAHFVMGSEYLDMLERLVELLYEKALPFRRQ
jgi:hypothetical protein